MVSVSLFTREWIEIAPKRYFEQKVEVVSLFTREWIEICVTPAIPFATASPSLRGSGLKFLSRLWLPVVTAVSLFTREWIEIVFCATLSESRQSPSLRGSGLKCLHAIYADSGQRVSLFTREWIEIVFCATLSESRQSPSLRGSGLKSPHLQKSVMRCGLPLYEGVDWNCSVTVNCLCFNWVSLFTREWIEMALITVACAGT